MFEWFYYMDYGEALWMGIGIAAINFIFSFWLSTYLPKYHRLSGSLEQTLHRLRVLEQYIYRILFVVTFIVTSVLCLFQFDWLFGNSTVQTILSLFISYLLFGIILSVNRMITYKIGASIKGNDTTRLRIIGQVFLSLLFLYIPIIITISFFLTLYQGDINSFYSIGYLILFELSLFLVLFIVVIPMTIGKSLKAVPMEGSLIEDRLIAFVDKAGISHVKLYVWPAKNKKTNALVTGYRKMRIYIADTLMEQLTEKQIESILAHEIGHIKHFHLWIRRGLIVLFLILVYGLVVLLSPYVDSSTISSKMAFLIMMLFIILYLGFCMRMVTRLQERQADSFVLELGVDYRDFTIALLEIARLNQMLTKLNKVDEVFQTHPSIARRIKWIIQKANGSYEEIEKYKNVPIE